MGLYSLLGVQDAERNTIELDFMGPAIDEPAAEAHQTLLERGVPGLSDEQKAAWSRFIVSLMVRTPDKVQDIRAKGREKLRQTLEADPEEYATVRNGNPAETLWEWLQQNNPHVLYTPLTDHRSALSRAICGSRPRRKLIEGRWPRSPQSRTIGSSFPA